MLMSTLNSIDGVPRTPEASSPVIPVWKPDLYRIQQEAPRPRAVVCGWSVAHTPPEYGNVFHGALSHGEAASILSQDGDYLVRLSGHIYTLSLRFKGKVKHYKLYYDGQHYVKDKRFGTLAELVADGLLTLHMECEAGPYIVLMSDMVRYEHSPAYLTLNRLKKKAQQQQIEQVDYDKSHAFKTHTFKGLNWCEFCGNFLWGFTAQGVKCDDCGFSAHGKCSEKLPADCCPDLKNLRGVFGIDLTTLVKAHHSVRPFVVDKCVREIEARGLRTEGLYRVSGFADEMDSLRMALDRDGENADISAEVYDNINVIAGILKLYLRLLPLPLITYEAHPAMIRATQKSSLLQQVAGVKDALTLLPPAHFNTLKYLLAHLTRVVENEPYNKMTSQNLSTVFAPTLMPPPDLSKSPTSLPDMTNEIWAIQLLIDHQSLIFM
ncbi:beta-chimaerin [Homalodisca vitripennis]|uniref:beta-chimaerin n=1 Tax=Homalodisca vitripennis TaxID=197043 RepID=UPI001EEC2D79|nr:beta-chimaerin [Homalodisca vitripennis]